VTDDVVQALKLGTFSVDDDGGDDDDDDDDGLFRIRDVTDWSPLSVSTTVKSTVQLYMAHWLIVDCSQGSFTRMTVQFGETSSITCQEFHTHTNSIETAACYTRSSATAKKQSVNYAFRCSPVIIH